MEDPTALETRHSRPKTSHLPPRRLRLQKIGVAVGRPIFRLFFRLRVEGVEKLPSDGPYIMAPNHVSMLDWAFLMAALPEPYRFVVERPYYDHPVFGRGLKWNGAVGIRTDRADLPAMRTAHAILAAGEPLILFPEGRISLDGRPQTGLPGIIFLAATLRVPIVPVAIRGAFESFPRWATLPRPGRVTVAIGDPLPVPPKVPRAQQQKLADGMMNCIADLLDGKPSGERPW